MKIKRIIIPLIFLIVSSTSVLAKTQVSPLAATIDLNGLLFHGESSYEKYRQHSLQPYDPSYFIIELQYAPDRVNLWIRYYSFYDETLKPIDLYTNGWGSGEYNIFPDVATYIDITYYESQPDYGDVQYWGECWIPSGWD
ncbi:MAG: hypothetical protein NDF54_09380 [archaeon GB-1867-035]|nr:hypothetical protein [Candidatus Culexmicrobium profundum]